MAAAVDEFEFFLEKEWSDGLPVVTPTEERVQRMLKGTRRDPDEVIGRIPPAMETATVRTIAIHALMAGCKPEYLPVVLGGITLMLREELNLNAVQGTMGSAAPLMIVNGPYAQKIRLNGGRGCFGPGFRANASIGRAIRLMLLNLGGGMTGLGSSTVFSSPLRYTACLTENMEHSPWESLGVSLGYPPEDNVITCAMVDPPKFCFDDASREPGRLLTGIADTMAAMGSLNIHVPRCAVVVVMGPLHAKICANAGMSRADVHRRLRELAGRKVRDLKGGGAWRPERAQKINVDPDDDDCFVPAIKDPRDLQLMVGGGIGPISAVCHGWGGGSLAVHGTYEV
ncbi:MAG: hypothetical protein A3G24_19660 [Betaproteobacteria bacterium RIFCSPLOWO2_12_FULL_62_13]|nr:MAG: hypothetical protein A3G24_19660 [Betaproteobacteria bacterium RIFCSPLOWO2_12_FULL_62_13]